MRYLKQKKGVLTTINYRRSIRHTVSNINQRFTYETTSIQPMMLPGDGDYA